MVKLGSLFDGIGGFPYSATKYGITPVWASEIEPWPIKVTEYHYPDMVHLGDIAQISGAEIEPVDIITFGSPCQDLSVAGKRAGLEGERSGLFGEAVRIIREMRESTNGVYPRFAVWENVPGAFSSNGGQDFRAVLEEIAEAEIPMPKSGKWATAGMVRSETADIAWRVLDAQYWGVPQRRRRIFLVADFGGQCAGEILFKRKGLRGHFEPSGKKGQEIAATVRDGVDKPICIRMREGCVGGGKGPLISEGKSLILGCSNDQPLLTRIDSTPEGISDVVSSKWAKGTGGPAGDECYNLVVEPRSQDGVCRVHHDVVPTLNTAGGGQRQPCVMSVHQNQCGEVRTGDVANTLSTNSNPSGRNAPLIAFAANQRDEVVGDSTEESVYGIDHVITTGDNCTAQGPCVVKDGPMFTLKAADAHAVAKRLTSGTSDRHAVGYPDPANTLLNKANLSFRDDQDTFGVEMRKKRYTNHLQNKEGE